VRKINHADLLKIFMKIRINEFQIKINLKIMNQT